MQQYGNLNGTFSISISEENGTMRAYRQEVRRVDPEGHEDVAWLLESIEHTARVLQC